MHNLLTSVVLCLVAHTASAQCINGTPATPATATARPGVELIATAARPGPELIATAAAGTRDAPVMRKTSAVSHSKAQSGEGDEHRRPTGAMLLAALALMSGIALRRATLSGQ